MNIDVTALKAVEREKEIPSTRCCRRSRPRCSPRTGTPTAPQPHARVEIDRKTGAVTVLAQELDADGKVVREWDDTPTTSAGSRR